MKRNFFFMVLLAFLMLLLPLSGCAVENASEQTPIIFTYATHGNNGFDTNLVSILQDGTEKHRITTDSLDNHAPLYSPDGKYIAFLSAKSGATELYLMDADGSNLRQITSDINNDSDNFVHFLWAPDSGHILLEINKEWQILDLTTKELAPYPDWESSPSFYPIAFSHDGTQLLYLSSSQIRVQAKDGSNDHALIENEWRQFSAVWLSDDNQIIFSASKDVQNGSKGALYIVNTDGSDLKAITAEEFSMPLNFEVSPDDKTIAFYAEPSFAILEINSGEVIELFKTEYPDTIYSMTW